MHTFRSMTLALVACAGILSVTACTAGVTTASSASSPVTSPAAPTHGPSAAASSPGAAPAASTVAISGIGSFPIPSGAKVAENVVTTQATILFFTGIAPAAVSAFYTTALPRAGYTVDENAVIHASGTTEAIIEFSGHGFKGDMAALATFNDPGVTIAGLGHKNVTEVTLMPK